MLDGYIEVMELVLAAIVLSAVYVGAFVLTMNGGDRSAAVIASFVVIPALAVMTFIAELLLLARCDENCDETTSDWRHSTGGWQWTAQGVLAGVTLVLASAAFVLVIRRRERSSVAASSGAALGAIAWAAMLALA